MSEPQTFKCQYGILCQLLSVATQHQRVRVNLSFVRTVKIVGLVSSHPAACNALAKHAGKLMYDGAVSSIFSNYTEPLEVLEYLHAPHLMHCASMKGIACAK